VIVGRSATLVGVAAILAVTVQGCSSTDGSTVAYDATVIADGSCAAPEQQQLQQGGHLLGDEPPPVPWSSVPPTSGWHASGAGVSAGTYVEPVSELEQVLWLERGGVVVAYDPDLPSAQIGELNRLPASTSRTVVTPYDVAMPRPITLTAWGWLQRCDTVTPAAVEAFVAAYGGTGDGH
jgi:hypothetical protein